MDVRTQVSEVRASTTRKGFARRLRGDAASELRPARARARYAAAGAGADESEDTVEMQSMVG